MTRPPTRSGPKSPQTPQAAGGCVEPRPQGCLLRVHVVPNAARTSCAGLHDGALRVRLAAPPIEGRANDALLRWLCDELGLPRRAATLHSGETARRKAVLLACEAAQVLDWLRRQPDVP